MRSFRPSVQRDGDSILIELLPTRGSRVITFTGVVDLTDFYDVIGIEILDFHRQLGATSPPSDATGLPRWSYDDEMDAFYLRLADGSSPIQQSIVGNVEVDEDGLVAQLRIPNQEDHRA